MLYNNPFGTNYPFINPPCNNPADYTVQLVQDFYVTYYEQQLNYKLPLKLQSISTSHIKITDQDDNIVYDADVRSRLWNDKSYILQGENGSVIVYAIVDKSLTGTFIPNNKDLCLRSTYIQPLHVTSFKVGSTTSTSLTHDIVFAEGYNVSLSYDEEDTESIRPRSTVTIDVSPGEGTGRVPVVCSDQSIPIKSINEQKADSTGNINIYTDGCLDVSLAGKTTNVIYVKDECTPCCKCEEFTVTSKILDTNIDEYYTLGGMAESIRDCLVDLTELLSCGNVILLSSDEMCPVRAYLDTTWPRQPIITAEFRDTLPAVITNLRLHVKAECSPLLKHKALRTMYMEDIACDGVYHDTQDVDNFDRITANGLPIAEDSWVAVNEWDIDWSDKPIAPGGTVWCTVAARNAGLIKNPDGSTSYNEDMSNTWKYSIEEPIKVTVTATYDMLPNSCITDPSVDLNDCFYGIDIHKEHVVTGTIKGGYGYDDLTLDSGDIKVMKRVKELCYAHKGHRHDKE